jgi:hypothetical protein
VAYSGNLEALSAIAELPYFSEVINESSNEVSIINFDWNSKVGPLYCGQPQRNT